PSRRCGGSDCPVPGGVPPRPRRSAGGRLAHPLRIDTTTPSAAVPAGVSFDRPVPARSPRPVVESCLHAANLLYLASFLTRDMLWLRVLTCCGLGLGAAYFSCQAAPMYGPAAWHVAFLLINALQIRRLMRERGRMTLSAEQQAVARA